MKHLSMWTIYEGATDFPEQVVARRFEVLPGAAEPTGEIVTGTSVEEVRAKLPRGLFRIPRADTDEPQIVEVWV